MSRNKRSWYDNSNARRLGYRPQDDSEIYAREVLAKEGPGNAIGDLYQGGAFTHVEAVPNPAPLPRAKAAKQPVKRAVRKTAGKAKKK